MADVPLAARMRPRTIEEFVGQSHLIGPGKALTQLLEGGHLPSILRWGPAGTGKTTLAYLLADAVGAQLVQLSAVSSGVADARMVIEQAKGGLFRTVAPTVGLLTHLKHVVRLKPKSAVTLVSPTPSVTEYGWLWLPKSWPGSTGLVVCAWSGGSVVSSTSIR